jgi:hypothetical protein
MGNVEGALACPIGKLGHSARLICRAFTMAGIANRKGEKANRLAFEKVRTDKECEAKNGYVGQIVLLEVHEGTKTRRVSEILPALPAAGLPSDHEKSPAACCSGHTSSDPSISQIARLCTQSQAEKPADLTAAPIEHRLCCIHGARKCERAFPGRQRNCLSRPGSEKLPAPSDLTQLASSM